MLSGYYEHDRFHASGDGLGPFTPIEATTTNSQPNHNWRARVSRTVGARTTLEVDHAGATGLLCTTQHHRPHAPVHIPISIW